MCAIKTAGFVLKVIADDRPKFQPEGWENWLFPPLERQRWERCVYTE